jgi:antitoxin component YwqK of YwqJK toxin-antitoxin module
MCSAASIERRAGVRHGVERWYWPDGTVRIEGGWVDGEKHGRFVTYDDAGAVTVVTEYLHGVPVR